MTTKNRSAHLRSWIVRAGAFMLTVAFCSSAFADPSKNVVGPAKPAMHVATKRTVKCYRWITGYGMPIPCEQMSGAVATTSKALVTIGNQGNLAN